MAETLLDEALEDVVLGEWLPELQTSFPINEAGVTRLRKALDLGLAPIGRYASLGTGDVCAPVSGPAFRDLVLAIGAVPGGNRVALDVVFMRLNSNGSAKQPPSPETVEAGRRLLEQHVFLPRSNDADHDDHRLGSVAHHCLTGEEGAAAAQKIWRNLKAGIASSELYSWEHDDLVQALFAVQPEAMLDVLAAGDDADRRASIDLVAEVTQRRKNPIGAVSEDVLLQWGGADPVIRYPFIAAIAPLFESTVGGVDKIPRDWRPLAKTLLENAPEPVAVLRGIAHHLWPTQIEGSVASAFEARLRLLDRLEIGSDPALIAAFREEREKLAEHVEKWRRSELTENNRRPGFE
ncbi:hypothetical protein ACVIHC_000160 [Bradyrhizobium diazoefficiens]